MLKTLYNVMRARLGDDLEARWIIEYRTDYTLSDLIAAPESEISEDDLEKIDHDVARRLAGVPLTRIYGEAEFWGLKFGLSESTLDPRPETELIIELALKRFDTDQPLKILDLGTGTGCILIALLSEFLDAHGIGSDVSQGALAQAEKNAVFNGVDSRIKLVCTSWLEGIDSRFDLIVSNPPYICKSVIPTLSPEVIQHDPILALDGGAQGLNPYIEIIPKIKNNLSSYGIALFEIGYDQKDDVMRLAEKSGFVQRCVHMDYAGNPRVVEISHGDK